MKSIQRALLACATQAALGTLLSTVATATGITFCYGDGLGTPCPCGNNSTPGQNSGCGNSFGTPGNLVATGNPSITSDTLLFNATQMLNGTVRFYQGTTQVNFGLGTPLGDGLRCIGGSVVILKTTVGVGGAATFPLITDPMVSVAGSVLTPGTRTYQVQYRDNATYCTPAIFNTTNAVLVTWTP